MREDGNYTILSFFSHDARSFDVERQRKVKSACAEAHIPEFGFNTHHTIINYFLPSSAKRNGRAMLHSETATADNAQPMYTHTHRIAICLKTDAASCTWCMFSQAKTKDGNKELRASNTSRNASPLLNSRVVLSQLVLKGCGTHSREGELNNPHTEMAGALRSRSSAARFSSPGPPTRGREELPCMSRPQGPSKRAVTLRVHPCGWRSCQLGAVCLMSALSDTASCSAMRLEFGQIERSSFEKRRYGPCVAPERESASVKETSNAPTRGDPTSGGFLTTLRVPLPWRGSSASDKAVKASQYFELEPRR
mmetsp:Transcript_21613/g.47252  ORF Transcript_21613/g.47252 Transcript_21613/m.47252 type:complete len:308 (-) Transcript_21613:233-1156(-)